MATLQELKKKLKSVRSTEKITKAMKTVSATKYSRLSRLFSEYSVYSDSCMSIYKAYEDEINSFFPEISPDAPDAVFIFSSNKGMCGGFNTEIFSLTESTLSEMPENTLFFPCGKKAAAFFQEKGIPYESSFVFSDIPASEEAAAFLDSVLLMQKEGKIGRCLAIYPRYKNVIKQIPVCTGLFSDKKHEEDTSGLSAEAPLFVPDRETVMKSLAQKVIFAAVYRIILETALGAQASTLTTMRSAYDTASAYGAQLEIQINRKRQSEVTADVLETSSDREDF